MWIDISLVILLIYGIWKGLKQGLIISVFTLLAWVVGILAAIKLSSEASQWIQQQFDIHSNYLPVISFLAVFFIIALIIYLIGKSLEKVVEIAHLGFINKLGGAILRIAIYTLVFSIFIWLLNEAGFISPEVKTQSKTYFLISGVSDYAINHLSEYIPAVKEMFAELQQFFENISKSAQQM
jgi:membrane protein required for colicin V production